MANNKPISWYVKVILPVVVGFIIALLPPLGEPLTVESMRFGGIFICIIMMMIFNIFPDFVISTSGLVLMVALKVTDFGTAFSPFAGTAVWLVVAAFGLGAAVAKTGLLKRISYLVLKLFPETFKGQILAFYTAGLVVSPLIPSLTAKGTVLGPFAAQVAESLGYEKDSKGARGLFAAVTIMATIVGMAFLSGAVPVATLIGMMPEEFRADMTFFGWLKGTWVWLIITLVLTFFSILALYTPKDSDKAAESGLAQKELEKMGPASTHEKIAFICLLFALVGWMTTKLTGMNTTVVGLIALMILFLTGVMKAPDFKNLIAWPAVTFIGNVYALAALISKMGWATYLAEVLRPILGPVASNAWLLVPVICIVTYAMRVVVMSQTAGVTIIWAIFGGLALEYGIHPFVILFPGYLATLVWHYPGNNTTTTTLLASTGDNMVTFNGTFQYNIVYMIVTLIACTASVPLWKMIGYC